jgi:hypothetical protein
MGSTSDIRGPGGQIVATLYFWDEPDTSEAEEARQAAELIVKNLNRWWGPDG